MWVTWSIEMLWWSDLFTSRMLDEEFLDLKDSRSIYGSLDLFS